MEQLNSVTLRGIIGNARIQTIGDTEMARFSVATDHAFKNRSGEAVIETTWHQVTAFKSDRMPDFSTLVKGAGVSATTGSPTPTVWKGPSPRSSHLRSASSAGRFSKPSGRRVLRSRLLFCAATGINPPGRIFSR